MLEFGKLEIVEKTFTREPGAVRGQAYEGIKFRRYESTKGKKAAEEAGEAWTPFIEEQFVISNKAFAQLNLEENALVQAKQGNQVFLLVVDDQEAVEPAAKFARRSTNKDGSLAKKGKMFSNEFLMNDLIAVGALNKDGKGNQYLSITDVTKEVAGAPAVVHAIYLLDVDKSVDPAKDNEEETVASDVAAGF